MDKGHGDDSEREQWQQTTQLPSFYSPLAKATDAATSGDLDQNASLPLLPGAVAPLPDNGEDAASLGSSTPSSLPSRLPPASLLSPPFTPPSTPGAATPALSATSGGDAAGPNQYIPRGVPVDSSISAGGCGSARPRLVETLPEVQCIVRARIPNSLTQTEMWLHVYKNNFDNKEHLAIVFGTGIRSKSLDEPVPGETEWDRMARGAYIGRLYPGRTSSGMGSSALAESRTAEGGVTMGTPLVRVHSECYTGETVWSARCDCGEQLDEAARLMSHPENSAGGVIIYLRQEGRGIGLSEKLKAYNLQDLGSDTVEANLLLRHPADARSYGLATAMLMDLGQGEVRLLTNNPEKIRAVEGPNREIVVKERVPMVPLAWRGKAGVHGPEFEGYLKTKINKMGHLLPQGPAA